MLRGFETGDRVYYSGNVAVPSMTGTLVKEQANGFWFKPDLEDIETDDEPFHISISLFTKQTVANYNHANQVVKLSEREEILQEILQNK